MSPRARARLLALLLAVGCAPEEPPVSGLTARVFLDRTELSVGEPLGVTVEIETPPGFAVEKPTAPPPEPHFVTESIERLDPLLLPAGLRHRLKWTLRARDVGAPSLPTLQLPLVRPDGAIQPLAVGGIPVPVRSIRAALPEREVYFDIQPPPEPAPRARGWLWLAAGLALAGLALGGLALRRRERRPAEPTLAELRRDTARRLEECLEQRDPRALAGSLAAAIWEFVERVAHQPTAARTADELPAGVDPRLRPLLVGLERARFQRAPQRGEALALAAEARRFFGDAPHA